MAVSVRGLSVTMYGRAWNIFAVCFGRAQKPPLIEGESTYVSKIFEENTHISPTTSGGHITFVSGFTIANVASAIGYPNPPTLTIPASAARRLASSPYC
jgi:hypothetical protein